MSFCIIQGQSEHALRSVEIAELDLTQCRVLSLSRFVDGRRKMVGAFRQLSLTAVIFVLGLLTAHSPAYPTTLLQTEDKKSPEAFLSGGARSEKVLVEILATLKQIDTRISNIEDHLQKTAETPTEKPGRNK
jgi:hypothetical protein